MQPHRAWPFLSDPSHPLLSAVWSVGIHGVVAVAVVAPLLWRSDRPLLLGAAAFISTSLFDLDHVVAAGTFNLHAMETISGGRPVTHSIGFVLILAAVAFALSRSLSFAWGVFAILVSHLLFDAAGGSEQILYPVSGVDSVPWLLCPLGSLALLGGSVAVARHAERAASRARADESLAPAVKAA